jgi:hypothetical protein
MGELSRRLQRKLRSMASDAPFRTSREGLKPNPGAPDVAKLIEEGYDPVHAAYILGHHFTSVFSEKVSHLPEMRSYAEEVGSAEEQYMPSGPPMSPLTKSYFSCWSFFDHRIGKTTDTLADCVIEANDTIWMNPDKLEALSKMNESRMGIYEHEGWQENFVRLRELIIDREFICHIGSGYRGKAGELWYVRLFPPLLPDLATYHVAFTTPYVLTGATKKDWLDFLKRSMVGMRASSEVEALHRLMKVGPSSNYWNEFVFLAYHHQKSDAIYLTGIPDLKSTLPDA